MAIRRTAVACAAAVLAAVVAAPAPAGAQDDVHHLPPVDAPVADPFRSPPTPYGAGNRGLTYDLPGGSPVAATAAGEVVYAGPVAGTLHVTVLHADGIRTSYSFLESVQVRRGQRVEQGDVVGLGGPGFHLGAREGDAYLDPAGLFGGFQVRVRLVPHEELLPPTDAGLLRERIALLEKVRERGLLDRLRSAVGRGIEVVGAGVEIFDQLKPSAIALEAGENLAAGLLSLLDCTDAGQAPPAVDASGRVAVLVAGHASTSADASIDDLAVGELGYDPSQVLRYRYGGGHVGVGEYDVADTWGDLEVEARHLADLVEDVAATRPGAPVDVYAHSQGGIVTRLALYELAERGRLDVLGQVVTMGTPHDGTELATGAQVLDGPERESIEWLAGVAGTELDTDARSVQQMSEASEVVFRLRVDGVPEGVDLLTIGARGDLVVTGDKTSVDGAPHAMLDLAGPSAHHAIPGSPATTREVQLALAGLPPTCRDLGDIILDATVPEGISFGENALIAGYAV